MPDDTTTETTTTTGAADDSAASAASTTDTGTNPTGTAGSDASGAATTETTQEVTYDLKLPKDSPLSTEWLERTAANARARGLTNEQAQAELESLAQESAVLADARTAEALDSFAPPSDENPEGGAKWREQDEAWRAAALADKELGNGNPETLKANTELAQRVLAKFGDKDSLAFLEKSGLGSNPATLRILVKIGKAMSEGSLVLPQASGEPAVQSLEDIMYPGMKDGYKDGVAAEGAVAAHSY